MTKYLIFALLLISSVLSAEPRVRPASWGQQVIGTKLNNLYLHKFDSLIKNIQDDLDIEFAYVSIYKFFWKCISEAALKCGINKSYLKYGKLNKSWELIRTELSKIFNQKDFQEWNRIINQIHSFRNKFAHGISREDLPEIESMKTWRRKSLGFIKWLENAIGDYIKYSSGYFATKDFTQIVDLYIRKARGFIKIFGKDKIPQIVNDPYFHFIFPYEELSKKVEELNRYFKNLKDINAIDQTYLVDFMNLVNYIGIIDAREYSALENGECPICGGEIKDYSRSIGSTDSDEPEGEIYITGCENRDYILNKETIMF